MLKESPFCSRLNPSLFVVTAARGEERSGCLVGFVTQCSIAPPRVLVNISLLNRTYEVARSAGALGLHLLAGDQRELAYLFGGETGDEGVDKFSQCAWHFGQTGVPLLEDCAAWMEGSVLAEIPVGDHVAFLLSVVHDGVSEQSGELRITDVRGLLAGHPPDEIDETGVAGPR